MRSLLAFLAGVFSTEYFVVVPQISILMGLLLLTVILFIFVLLPFDMLGFRAHQL
jgi:hypothetical protein